MRGQFSGDAIPVWELERDGEIVRVDPPSSLLGRSGAAFDLALQAALDGLGILHLFEDWLQPHLDSGALVPLLEPVSALQRALALLRRTASSAVAVKGVCGVCAGGLLALSRSFNSFRFQ
jgi:DNA-binding transcriptional LysR family regulator